MKLDKYFVGGQILLIFALCIVEGQSSSCGGILVTSVGTLKISTPTSPQLCVWAIKLPVPSTVIQFHLDEIPASSQLSLYPQEGHVAGQFTVRPIALTTANSSSTVATNSSNMVVVWAPSAGFDSESPIQLTFKWAAIQGQNQDSDLVDGVGYVEGAEGEFSWEKAGEGQQTLLWVLNSQDSGESVDLTTKTDFDSCDLVDFCLCSYLGVYQVYDNFLQAVTTECGRSSSHNFENLRPALVVLGFVNPKYQSGDSFVTLTWKHGSKNETTTTTTTEQPTTCSSGRPKSCAEIQSAGGSGVNSSQICAIYPFGPEKESVDVLCDFVTDGGGWTIFQKRSSGPKEEFNRNWTDYEAGFGSVNGNYWIGLETIRALTKEGDQELRIDLWDFLGDHAYAQYANFSISPSSDYYRLAVGGYSGTAGDSLVYSGASNLNVNGMRFSSRDKDNDNDDDRRCVDNNKGAWWYNACGLSDLNGFYYEHGLTPDPEPSGIRWFLWKDSNRSLKQVEMKIRQRR